MTTAEMVTYAYDQIDQARAELNTVSKWTLIRDSVDDCEDTRSTLLSTRGRSNTLAAGPLDLDRRQFHAIAGK